MSVAFVVLHHVGFGECVTVCGDHKELLLVDCGSLHSRLPDGTLFSQYVAALPQQYYDTTERVFLLSHFHQDHFCGLPYLLKAEPAFFHRIYLPLSPKDCRGRLPLLELTLWIQCFVTGKGKETVKANGQGLRFLQRISRLTSPELFYFLGGGDVVTAGGETFTVLWPPKVSYPFPEELQALISQCKRLLQSSSDPYAVAFLHQMELVYQAYDHMQCCFSPSTEATAQQREESLTVLEQEQATLSALLPPLHTLKAAQEVSALLSSESMVRVASMAVNGSSMVLQSKDILLTGDATPATMEQLAPQLQEDYWLVKAPHHGTASCYFPGFETMGIQHLLISNSSARGCGKIAKAYAMLNALHHCNEGTHCQYALEEGHCCNDNLYCPLAMAKDGVPTHCTQPNCKIFKANCGEHGSCQCL